MMTPKITPSKGHLRALNNLRNGSRVTRLALGALPKALSRVTRYCQAYRRGLETAVVEAHGEVTLSQAHHVDAACGHEQHVQICRWLLRERIGTMSTGDIITCSRTMAQARDARNKAVEQLDLDCEPEPPDLRAYLASKQSEEDNPECPE
jgi:hypothetical protein